MLTANQDCYYFCYYYVIHTTTYKYYTHTHTQSIDL